MKKDCRLECPYIILKQEKNGGNEIIASAKNWQDGKSITDMFQKGNEDTFLLTDMENYICYSHGIESNN